MANQNGVEFPFPCYAEFFERVDGVTYGTGNFKVRCKLCVNKKELSSNVSSSGNLKKHIASCHRDRMPDLETSINQRKKRKSLMNEEQINVVPRRKQMKLEEMPCMQSMTISQDSFDRLLMDFFIESLEPLSVCDTTHEGLAFEALIKGLDPTKSVMCSETLRTRLDDSFAKTKNLIIKSLAEVEYVSLTADCWSSGKRRFLGVTAHWICPSTLVRENATLGCQRLKGGHTYEVLATTLQEILHEFQIHTKITGVTTDNGSHFVKAFRKFGIPNSSSSDDSSDSELEWIELTDVLENPLLDSEDPTPSNNIYLPPHFRCASHTLHLVVTKDLEAALRLPKIKTASRQAFAKCRALWGKENFAIVAGIVSGNAGVVLKAPADAGWNGFFDALAHLQTLFETGDVTKCDIMCDSLALPHFQKTEMTFISEYVEVMQPLACAIDILQNENNMYMGYLLPVLYQTVCKLTILEQTRTFHFCLPLLTAIVNGIKTRFESIWWAKPLVIAACSHPKFKLNWLPNERRDEAFAWLLAETKSQQSDFEYVNASSVSDDDRKYEELEANFFDFLPRPTQVDEGRKLLEQFLKCNDNNLNVLESFPVVKQIFVKFNTNLPSSERTFRDGFDRDREALSDSSCSKQLFLKLNRKYRLLD